jgi:Zn-dependent protease with chaperone function
MRAAILPILICSLLGACANSPNGRSQLAVPQPVSEIYSEVNMRLQLATTADVHYQCAESECDASKEFEMRVARLGGQLAEKAYALYPDLHERVERFDFLTSDKAEPGTTSNASGTVVVFSGTRALEPSDPALAFVLAREMGHVIGRHHDENIATRIIVSVLAQVLMPVSGLFRALAQLQTASSAATASATTATATAASFLGSHAVIATYRPQQLAEADTIALTMLARLHYDPQETADALAEAEQRLDDSGWTQDLRASSGHVAQIAQGPRADKERLAQLAASVPPKLTYAVGVPSTGTTEAGPRALTQ